MANLVYPGFCFCIFGTLFAQLYINFFCDRLLGINSHFIALGFKPYSTNTDVYSNVNYISVAFAQMVDTDFSWDI